MRAFFLTLLILTLIPTLLAFSSETFYSTLSSNSFTIVNGNIYLGTPYGIYSLSNDSYILKGYNITCLAYLNGFYFITSNDSLFYYNNGNVVYINISMPQRLFVDNYTGELYVVADYQYVYVLKGTQVVKSYFIYKSFGFLTFTNDYAVVDSQEGYTILYYNGTNRTVMYYQYALTGMIFANNTFISGSSSPNGLWIFKNLSVLNYQLPYYNMVYVPLPFTPYWIYYSDGIIYVAGYEGYAIIDAENNYQLLYVNSTEVHYASGYAGYFYVLTNYGLLKIRVSPPPVYNLTIREFGLPKDSVWKIEINGTTYILSNDVLTLKLAGGYVYNITFFKYLGFVPNITSISLNLTGNTLITVNYSTELVPVIIIVNGINNGTNWNLYINGSKILENKNYVILYLHNSSSYLFNVSISGYKVYPINYIYSVNNNSIIVFTATPMISSSQQPNSQSPPSVSVQSQFPIIIIVFLVIIAFFLFFIIKGVMMRK